MKTTEERASSFKVRIGGSVGDPDEDDKKPWNWPRAIALLFQIAGIAIIIAIMAQCESGQIW